MAPTCSQCSADLVDGPNLNSTVEADGWLCEVRGIPTKVCPRGCRERQWYSPDFGREVFDAFSADSPNIARRKGLFKTRQLCRRCEVGLESSDSAGIFRFQKALGKGTSIEMTITAPSLTCKQCGAIYMPAPASIQDRYYSVLGEIITRAISKDFEEGSTP